MALKPQEEKSRSWSQYTLIFNQMISLFLLLHLSLGITWFDCLLGLLHSSALYFAWYQKCISMYSVFGKNSVNICSKWFFLKTCWRRRREDAFRSCFVPEGSCVYYFSWIQTGGDHTRQDITDLNRNLTLFVLLSLLSTYHRRFCFPLMLFICDPKTNKVIFPFYRWRGAVSYSSHWSRRSNKRTLLYTERSQKNINVLETLYQDSCT